MKKSILCGFFLLTSALLFAQDPMHFTNSNLPCVQRVFYPHVFVVKDSLGNPVVSNQELIQYFDMLNSAFRPICIAFAPCNLEYIEDYSFSYISDYNEILSLTSRNNKKRRFNIYFTDVVFDKELNSFSNFNSITDPLGATLIIPKSGTGFIHEMGHTFGLYHTFETEFGLEKVDQSNCATAGDKICDTPAMPEKKYQNNRCEYLSIVKDPDGKYYKPEIGNYMSHYFCAHCFFSKEQYIKMAENYLSSPFKMW